MLKHLQKSLLITHLKYQMTAVLPVQNDETVKKLLQGENHILVVTDDDWIKYIHFEAQIFEF